jgi:dipeptide/tripeptide permease
MKEKKVSVLKQFPRTFWVANTVELLERWSWYGLFVVLALYLTSSKDTGALGFTQIQKGSMMGTISAMVYFLPIFTGAVADKIGYKISLLLAFSLYFSGFLLMSQLTSYYAVYMAFALVGLGAAIFKPIISATIAKTTNPQNASIGFGIFYMMVNIGAFIGPIVASKLREINWLYVFYVSAAIIALNMLLVFFFFKEPLREKNKDSISDSILAILRNILQVILDFKFVSFLILIIGFWTMYLQLFFTMPVFIEQWVDTTAMYNSIAAISPWLASAVGTKDGNIAAEMIINTDAFFIIAFQLFVSAFVMKFKPLNTMISGILIAAIGVGLMFIFTNPFFIITAILIFSLGEMASSPKITEYIGRIAPADKKGLYMGMSFLPLAGGNFLAGYLSGNIYGKMSDKIRLLETEFNKHHWTIPKRGELFTKNDFIALGSEKLGMNTHELTNYLWDTYHPSHIWYVFTAIGMITVTGLWIYDKIITSRRL